MLPFPYNQILQLQWRKNPQLGLQRPLAHLHPEVIVPQPHLHPEVIVPQPHLHPEVIVPLPEDR